MNEGDIAVGHGQQPRSDPDFEIGMGGGRVARGSADGQQCRFRRQLADQEHIA